MLTIAFIVEGTHDADKLKTFFHHTYPTVSTLFVVTNGTRMKPRTREEIAAVLEKTPHVFAAFDPDEAGDQIYRMLQNFFRVPRVMFDVEECRHIQIFEGHQKHKIGIEHASFTYLHRVFSPLFLQSLGD